MQPVFCRFLDYISSCQVLFRVVLCYVLSYFVCSQELCYVRSYVLCCQKCVLFFASMGIAKSCAAFFIILTVAFPVLRYSTYYQNYCCVLGYISVAENILFYFKLLIVLHSHYYWPTIMTFIYFVCKVNINTMTFLIKKSKNNRCMFAFFIHTMVDHSLNDFIKA